MGCTEYSVGTVKVDCRLLLPQTLHRNWNTEGLGGDAHPALARSGRERAASTLTLAAGCPKHEAQHSWRRSCALRRNRFYKIGGYILIGVAECGTVRLAWYQPQAASQLCWRQRWNPRDPIDMLRPARLQHGNRGLL